ncbi:hypothetical protein HOLleu_44308 [Holothuria leucospilota]|uniref:Uncharacterized protein n=1 Tax=Holothuria leucospilota TaxID=206669 RepID=A0A9Q1B8Q2_HOLLE|nr:hypothetical protein HOLleu_44308 [Holothuria leucospilota]
MDENPSEKGSHSRKRPRERKSTNICLHKTYEEWAHQKEKYEEHRKAFRLSSGMSSRDFRDTATHGDFAKHLLESHSRFCEFCRKNANLTPTETFPIPDQPPASYTVFTDACTQTETESPDDDATADSSQGHVHLRQGIPSGVQNAALQKLHNTASAANWTVNTRYIYVNIFSKLGAQRVHHLYSSFTILSLGSVVQVNKCSTCALFDNGTSFQ